MAKESEFGALVVQTGKFLREKYIRDRDFVPRGVRGYRATNYAGLVNKLDGLKDGMMIVVARSNVGKTTFALSLAVDVMTTYLCENEDAPPSVIIYTLDDNRDETTDCLISCLTGLPRDTVDRSRQGDADKEELISKAYDTVIDLVNNGYLDIVCLDDIQTWSNLIADIERQYERNPRLIVFIDGISQIEYDKKTKRLESNENKSIEMKQLANRLRIPIIITQEPPKTGCPIRPGKDDIAETRRWGFDAKVVIGLSDLDNQVREEIAKSEGMAKIYPEIVISVEKNKWSSFKSFFFARLITSRVKIDMIPFSGEMLARKLDFEYGSRPRKGSNTNG